MAKYEVHYKGKLFNVVEISRTEKAEYIKTLRKSLPGALLIEIKAPQPPKAKKKKTKPAKKVEEIKEDVPRETSEEII
jgi:hypothetical protein